MDQISNPKTISHTITFYCSKTKLSYLIWPLICLPYGTFLLSVVFLRLPLPFFNWTHFLCGTLQRMSGVILIYNLPLGRMCQFKIFVNLHPQDICSNIVHNIEILTIGNIAKIHIKIIHYLLVLSPLGHVNLFEIWNLKKR